MMHIHEVMLLEIIKHFALYATILQCGFLLSDKTNPIDV